MALKSVFFCFGKTEQFFLLFMEHLQALAKQIVEGFLRILALGNILPDGLHACLRSSQAAIARLQRKKQVEIIENWKLSKYGARTLVMPLK